jgi:hypothetical protein
MAGGNEQPTVRSLEERRFDEECRKARRDEKLRIAELRIRRLELKNRRGRTGELFSPLGVAAIAGLIGIIGSLVSGVQNRNIESEKQAATEKLERQKEQADLILKLAEQPDVKQRALNLLFFSEGGYLTLPAAYGDYLRGVAGLKAGDTVPAPSLTSYVQVPARHSTGLTRATQETMIELFGVPGELTSQCSEPTNDRLKRLLVSEDIGPFKIRAIRPVVDAVKLVMQDVKAENPDLYAAVGSAGALCIRKVRMFDRYSMHSWGTALDVVIAGRTPSFQPGVSQYGLLLLVPFFEKQGFVWDPSDGIHFEASEQILRQWSQEGKLD